MIIVQLRASDAFPDVEISGLFRVVASEPFRSLIQLVASYLAIDRHYHKYLIQIMVQSIGQAVPIWASC